VRSSSSKTYHMPSLPRSPGSPPHVNEMEQHYSEAPASPSNSWSSTETALAAPLQAGEEPGADGAASRPKRCKISREQLAVLIKSFEEEPLPNFDQRQAMAKQLGMTPRSVQIWFQNRRQRLKPISKSVSAPDLSSQTSGSHGSAHFGMPGLAAAAGLFGGGMLPGAASQLPMPSGGFGVQPFLSSEVMEPFAATKALLGANYQHSQSSILGLGLRFPHGSAAGLSPLSSAREQLMQQAVAASQQQQHAQHQAQHAAQHAAQQQAAASSIDVGPTPSTQATFAGSADGSSPMIRPQSSPDCVGTYGAAAQQQAAPAAADGLLLLLACAGDSKAPKDEQPPAPSGVTA